MRFEIGPPSASWAGRIIGANRAGIIGVVDLSVVIPCYNEARNIAALLERLRPVLEGLQLSYEVVFVDDGSRDDTLVVLENCHAVDPRLKAVVLSRNFGKETALTAGLRYAKGAAVVPMDADLQHPPELIPQLIKEWREGAEVVVAVRRSRGTDPWWRRIASRAFFKMFNMLSDTPIVEGGGDFRLFDRRVIDIINRLPERARFLKGLYAWVGFRQRTVPYDVQPRYDGKTTFNVLRLLRYSVDALTSFSTFPLRMWLYIGSVVVFLSLLYGVWVAIDVLLHGKEVPGFASIVILIVLIGGIQFLTLGIMGEYIGRILSEVKARPLFVVRETLGIDEESNRGSASGVQLVTSAQPENAARQGSRHADQGN
jgi:polyisoprenyl-phosphate glycosyltransferase